MSKIDIDKFISEMFHRHEKTSSAYTPEHWKNFEQLLDRETAKRKKGGFSLNNLLFFSSAFILIMLIPLLFLRSDTVNIATEQSQKDEFKTNEVSLKINNDSSIITKSEIPNESIVINAASEIMNPDYFVTNKIADFPEDVSITKANSEVKYAIEIDCILPLRMTEIDIIQNTPGMALFAKKEFKPGDSTDSKKRGRIKRGKVLMPHFYYNGF
jgi:hypothetical protein